MTPQPAIVRMHAVQMTRIMCRQCAITPVERIGLVCPRCVIVLANRETGAAEFRRGLITLAILGLAIGVVGAVAAFMLLG